MINLFDQLELEQSILSNVPENCPHSHNIRELRFFVLESLRQGSPPIEAIATCQVSNRRRSVCRNCPLFQGINIAK